MAIATPAPVGLAPKAAPKRHSPLRQESIWRAPLVPAALAFTVGILLDRYASVPLPVSLVAFVAGLFAWKVTCTGQQTVLSLAYLGVTIAAFGAAYHHWFHDFYPADDIGAYVTSEPRPVKLRGTIAEEPF